MAGSVLRGEVDCCGGGAGEVFVGGTELAG